MKSIAVINQKGGVGKTTSVVNLAACLEKDRSKKVLVIDCDSQCNATSYLTTFSDEQGCDILSYLNQQNKAEEIVQQIKMEWRGRIINTEMYLIRGTTQMDTVPIPDEKVFKQLLDELSSFEFDYVFFDCPANLTAPTLAALSAADFVLIPAETDMDSLGGYGLLLDTIHTIRTTTNVGLKSLGVFFTKVSANVSLDQYIFEQNRQALKNEVFETYIRSATKIPQARFFGKPVTYYKSSSKVASDYRKLADEIVEKITEKGM